MAEFRAPANDGEVLAVPDFAAIPLVEENRRKLDRDDEDRRNAPRELRRPRRKCWIRERRQGRVDRDALLTPPAISPNSRPGVWVKNLALNGPGRSSAASPPPRRR